KEERPVSRDRTAQGSAELVLLERIFTRTVENRPRRKRVVHPELVQRSGSLIGAGLGDDVDEAAERAAVLGKISGVENAEFPGRLLRGRRARQPRERLDVVGAVDLNHRVQLGLACE